MVKKKLIVLSGAGISAESGIKTFRDSGGLWEGHRVEDVATPEAWIRNPSLVMDFYNQRRKQLLEVKPNRAHEILQELENDFDVQIITQNVDNLHERAGSTKVLHLHGELSKQRSSINPALIEEVNGWEMEMGTLCPLGSQWRPHIVWFGEAVPKMDEAIPLCAEADILLIIGTSLVVYPAASLMHYVPSDCKIYLIDPSIPIEIRLNKNVICYEEKASKGMEKLKTELI
ncbi:UNVERIFIED_CONTAM: hypothetical protein GTU68_033818 [Idotea baltica]|nr:hypothetical protein [Idotea baltica]